MWFRLIKTDSKSKARRGELILPRGVVQTPVFMPVGTVGSVKAVSNEELKSLGAQIVLGNTYHLHLRPTSEFIRDTYGSLHRFNGWDRSILTDSGGYQVFSLGRTTGEGPNLVKISENGVEFRSHIDGSRHVFTPERVIDIQRNLGSDIMMPLDVCPDGNADESTIKSAMEQTHRFAERAISWAESLGIHEARKTNHGFSPESSTDWVRNPQSVTGSSLFGIVQGGPIPKLRRQSADYISGLNFDGIAIGGVANGGESKDNIELAIESALPYIPPGKPRYLMGIGEPEDMIRAVASGIDMFDCVLPTRLGRHGVAWVGDETAGFEAIHLTKNDFRSSRQVLQQSCVCLACSKGYSRGYIHHLAKEKEILGIRLLTLHNLRFSFALFERMRRSIQSDTFSTDFERILK